MKNIFVACAMKREVKPLLDKLENITTETILGFNFYRGIFNNHSIIIGVSSPGLINMSSLVTVALIKYDIDIILNFGMVGGCEENIHKNSIIVGTDCMNTNSYVTGKLDTGVDIKKWNFITFTDGGEDKLVVYDTDKSLLDITKKITSDAVIHYGRIGSSDVWNLENDKILLLNRKYKVLCEDMESVSIYQIALKANIPCISIKGVSDNKILEEGYDDSVIPILMDYIYKFINNI